ncbi:MAG: NADH-quinone oxidoreductase subunit L [candidate division FCPU426 bacterium]
MSTLYPVLFLPLISAALIRLWGARLGKTMVALVACASVGVAFIFAAASFLRLAALEPEHRHVVVPVFEWLKVGAENFRFDLMLDPLSAVMIGVVTGVGSLIHVYSSNYMHEESPSEYARYFAYLNFFIFSMLTLVLSANFIVLFIGWELVGLSSYLLIGFFRSKTSAADAGKKAFIVNRVGDFGFILAIFLILGLFGSVNFSEVLAQPGSKIVAGSSMATAIALLLFMGAMGKSAQLPLHVWLPDAMEGPTPVSALIHAATMVTAGVFMVARCHALFELSPVAMAFVAWTGALTALFAASIALVQNDIKRIMAYSTLSQLGYMVMGVGVGAYGAGFFHLFTHAFFKALLFLGCGSVMHALHGELDLTKMGGLRSKMPVTYWTFLIGSLCLIGFPLTSGFFSKDEILYQALVSPHGSGALWFLGVLASMCTAFYVSRLFFKTFHGEPRDHHIWEHAHESAPAMAIPLVILAVLSLAVGLLGLPHFLTHWAPFETWLEPVFSDLGASKVEATVDPLPLMGLYTVIAFSFIGLGWAWFARPSETPGRVAGAFRYVHKILWNKYYIDELYDLVFVRGFLGSARVVYRYFEAGVIDGALNGLASLAKAGGDLLGRRLANGYVRVYAGALVFGAAVLLLLVLRAF